jgi:hypothetical protein
MPRHVGKRREKRMATVHPIRLWGMDSRGRPFIEAASTLDVSGKGARLKDVKAKLAVGDVVGLSSGGQKGRFRVVWVGQAGTSEASHVGLQSLEFKKHLWDLKLPDGSFDTYTLPPRREHRLLTRLKCSLSVEVRSDGADKQVWAFIKNISMGGCYVAMTPPLPVKAKLRIAMWLDDETKIWADGIVISSHPGSGMGIKFLALSRKNLDALEQFLKLSSDPGVPSSAPVNS